MNGITFITATGSRPLAFSLCQNWIRNQTLQPDQWIVIDDGKTPIKPVISLREILYLRRNPLRKDPKQTLLLNLREALPYIKGNKILFIEDDEYYAPKYAETMSAKLDEHEIVGINNARYYYLPTYANCRCGNRKHASLAQTAFRKSFLQEFSRLVTIETDALDMKLWKEVNKTNRGHLFLDDAEPLYVGMKGLPGRRGRGGSHTSESWKYKQSFMDTNKRLLQYWIPDKDDFKIYLDLIAGRLRTRNHLSYFKVRET